MRLCLFLHIWQLQKTNTALWCSQVNGAHLKVLPRSDSSVKATSLSQAPRRHYRFWRVELCCHVTKPQAAVIHQEHDSVLEISLRYWLGANLTAASLGVCLGHGCRCEAHHEGPYSFGGASTLFCSPGTQRRKFCPSSALWLWESLCLKVPTGTWGHQCWPAH